MPEILFITTEPATRAKERDTDEAFSEGSASAFDGTEQISDDPYDFLEKDDLLERVISPEQEALSKQAKTGKHY